MICRDSVEPWEELGTGSKVCSFERWRACQLCKKLKKPLWWMMNEGSHMLEGARAQKDPISAPFR